MAYNHSNKMNKYYRGSLIEDLIKIFRPLQIIDYYIDKWKVTGKITKKEIEIMTYYAELESIKNE